MPEQYLKIRDSLLESGKSEEEAKRIAAATYNKHHPGAPMGPHTHDEDEFTDFYADLPTDYSKLKPVQPGSPAEVFCHFHEAMPELVQDESFITDHEQAGLAMAVKIDRLLLDKLKTYLRHEIGEGRSEGQDVENAMVALGAEKMCEELVDEFLNDCFEQGCDAEMERLEA